MVWTKVGAKIEEALDSISFDDLLQHKDIDLKPRKKLSVTAKGVC
jgi:DNA-binding IscR family transcriptional regulator